MQWVTIHDTKVDGTASFDANAAAKAARATPFKRPENMAFLPGSHYQTFFFCPTGDTNADAGTAELAARGSWGSIFRVDLNWSRNDGLISVFFVGDADHARSITLPSPTITLSWLPKIVATCCTHSSTN
jgi:hypothetical protein